jgi:MoxR-like ATPase
MTGSPDANVDATAGALVERLRAAICATWHGPTATLDLLLSAVLAGGHVLIEDVPGVGKTTLAASLAAAMGGCVRRVQGTADLLPADLTGALVMDPRTRELSFRPGPLFAQVVLADEINRAPPRTQSALLEAMAEGSVTVDGEVRALPRPFFVLATQNPFDHHGTWPLPESQLDRFLLRIHLGYPRREDERRILHQTRGSAVLPAPVTSPDEVEVALRAVESVRFAAPIEDYLLDLVSMSRKDHRLLRGISPRGAAAWHRAARAYALVRSRSYVVPEDVRAVAVPVLAHRVVSRVPDGAVGVIEALLGELPAPR